MVKLTEQDLTRSRAEEAIIKAISKKLICQLHTGPLKHIHPDIGGAITICFKSAKDTEAMQMAITALTETDNLEG